MTDSTPPRPDMVLSCEDEFARASLNGAGSPRDGADTLIGGSGNDNLNGQAGNDVFDFSAGSGRDVVTGFAAGSRLGDVIQFHSQFTSFAQVLTAAHNVSNITSPLGAAFTGTVITSGADEIWLANIKLAQLATNDASS